MQANRYFLLNKPKNMVSQFISSHDVPLLSNLSFQFPSGTHAVGRLDQATEGLLLLTTNKKITKLLFQSEIPHQRTYLVKVKGAINQNTIEHLSKGILISSKQKSEYLTNPCQVQQISQPNNYLPNYQPHDTDQYVAHSWLLMSLTEGKFHQVRKMVAAAGHKCLRLIRISIEALTIQGIQPGDVLEISEESFFEKLSLQPSVSNSANISQSNHESVAESSTE